MTVNLVTPCDLVTILQRLFFNLLNKSFDLVTSCNLATVFAATKSVTKLRLHCAFFSLAFFMKLAINSCQCNKEELIFCRFCKGGKKVTAHSIFFLCYVALLICKKCDGPMIKNVLKIIPNPSS